nr:unnamed protein product [Callosobruchus analis]
MTQPSQVQPLGLLGSLGTFDPKTSDFSVFQERLNQFFIANGITEEQRKKAILLNTLSEDCYVLIRNLCVPELPENKTSSELFTLLVEHFTPVKSYFSERMKFYTARREVHESVASWEARVKSLAKNCGFNSNELNTVMRDVFVIGINNEKIMERLFEEDAAKTTTTFSTVLKIALARESSLNEHGSQECASTFTRSEAVNYHQVRGSTVRQPVRGSAKKNWRQRPELTVQENQCSVCGRKNHATSECAYANCVCFRCGVKGHLAPRCRRRVTERQNFVNDVESDIQENNIFCIEAMDNYCKFNSNIKPTYVKLIVENVPLSFEADSGFAHSAISEKLYLKHFKNKELFLNDLSLKDYVGVIFKPLGYLMLNINFEDGHYLLKTYVIKNGGPPLIGRNGLHMLNLGITKLNKDCTLNNIAHLESSDKIDPLLEKYADLFDKKIGTFNKFKLSLRLKKNAVPKFCKPRLVPFALREKIEKEIQRLEKNQVLVPTEFSDWSSPIVPVLKPNGDIRICGDFKVTLNPYLEIPQFPLPRIEYLFSQLRGGEKFSKIDLSDAYQQVELSEESRKLVTISTHKGLYSYTRLPYGISCAPAVFQNIMEQMLVNIPGVVCFLDDILVTGRNDCEHLERLELVFQKLQECGLKVKKEKCKFFENSVNYLGHTIDKLGLHTSEERVLAIKKAKVPENVTELKSFLGMINFYCKFVPNISKL